MDGRGGCCIARSATGAAYDMAKIDRIMLRFRPIAPKPVTKASDSGGGSTTSSDNCVKTGRGKRRYARNANNAANGGGGVTTKRCNSKRKRKSSSPEGNDKSVSDGSGSSGGENVVTLPLLPEIPDRKDSPARGSPSGVTGGGDDQCDVKRRAENAAPMWLSFKNKEVQPQKDRIEEGLMMGFCGVDREAVMVPQPVRLVGTWVRVERITSTWMDLYGLGHTDEEKVINLERDTCPGFISDSMNGVQWTNRAYREMVSNCIGGVSGEAMVWLVVKEGVTIPMSCSAFTCSVRLVTCGKEKSSRTLPCDVWRMNCGGFAWRLDMNAALSLGR